VDRECDFGFECDVTTSNGEGTGCRVDCPAGQKIVPRWGTPPGPGQRKTSYLSRSY